MSGAASTRDWAARYEAICAGGAAGLVHDHATHHVAVETSLGRIYGRDDWVAGFVAERAGFTGVDDARSEAWLAMSTPGRAVVAAIDRAVVHDGDSPLLGPPTGKRAVLSSTMVALVEGDRIYRAWRFVDHAAAARALGIDLDSRAEAIAGRAPKRGGIPWEFGEVRPGLGQAAPDPTAPPPPGLAAEHASACVQLQAAWNRRRFDRVASLYARDAACLDGAESIPPGGAQHPWARILVACPDAVLFLEHAASDVAAEGESRVALVWRWIGTHNGAGLGPPCGHRLHLRGISLLHVRDGLIGRERIVFDELGVRRDAFLRTISGSPRP